MDIIVNVVESSSGVVSTRDLRMIICVVGVALYLGICIAFFLQFSRSGAKEESWLLSYSKFLYASFIKPHRGSPDEDQQSALESFYETQVGMIFLQRSFAE